MKKKDIKILLVDDEPDILEIVGYNLSSEGYQISTAKNGVEAVAKAKKVKPHLIIISCISIWFSSFTQKKAFFKYFSLNSCSCIIFSF